MKYRLGAPGIVSENRVQKLLRMGLATLYGKDLLIIETAVAMTSIIEDLWSHAPQRSLRE